MVEEAAASGQGAMICCMQGANRSAIIATLYIAAKCGVLWEQAEAYIHELRPITDIRIGLRPGRDGAGATLVHPTASGLPRGCFSGDGLINHVQTGFASEFESQARQYDGLNPTMQTRDDCLQHHASLMQYFDHRPSASGLRDEGVWADPNAPDAGGHSPCARSAD